VIDLKTAIINVGEMLGVLDVKVRSAIRVAERFGWAPVSVSSLLIVADGSTNRRRIEAHEATFAAALPTRLLAIRRWLRSPSDSVHGLTFFADRRHGQVIQRFAHRERVTVRRTGPTGPGASSSERANEAAETDDATVPTLLTARTPIDAC
jgi:hypothetical protein